MKLLIDIPEDSYKATCNGCMLPPDVENVVQGIKYGTPLDDIKDEISKAYHDLPRYYPFALNTFAIIVDEILDSIGKAEREE